MSAPKAVSNADLDGVWPDFHGRDSLLGRRAEGPERAEPAPPAPPSYRESQTVARLHFEVGSMVAAATFAVETLLSTQDGTRLQDPRVARSIAVLRSALEEVVR